MLASFQGMHYPLINAKASEPNKAISLPFPLSPLSRRFFSNQRKSSIFSPSSLLSHSSFFSKKPKASSLLPRYFFLHFPTFFFKFSLPLSRSLIVSRVALCVLGLGVIFIERECFYATKFSRPSIPRHAFSVSLRFD